MISEEIEKILNGCLDSDGIRTRAEDLLTYGYDASRQSHLPDAVVFPKTVGQVSQILLVCNAHGLPVVPRGAGTGLTGGALPVNGGIVMVMKNFNKILSIEKENLLAVVEPGVINSHLQKTVEEIGLFYPPDPASMAISTIGGNIAENAGGMRAVKYGITKDFVMGLEVVLASGDIIHTGSKCIKDVVGYDITRLFVGSEGTLGVVTKAILKLVSKPESCQTLLAAFPDIESAARSVPDILISGIVPTALEFLDRFCMEAVKEIADSLVSPGAGSMLLMDVDGSPAEVARNMERICKICDQNDAMTIQVAADEKSREKLWRSRRSLHGALSKYNANWREEDISVPLSRLADILHKFEEISEKYKLIIACFGHAGDGNIHVNIAQESENDPSCYLEEGIECILKETIAMEGRIAAEHGIGLVKREKIAWNIDSSTLHFMKSLKQILDPKGILNPGKIFP